jgi:ribose transport system permease protein
LSATLKTRAAPASRPNFRKRVLRGLSFDRIGAVYVWIAIIIIFSIWIPTTFPTWATVQQILNSNAILGIAALAITIPFCARVFDLSFAYVMSLTGVTAAHFIAIGWGVAPSVAIALAVGLGMGLINGTVVVLLRIDSLIGTLATGSLILAFITLTTQDIPINSPKLGGAFARIGQTTIHGVSLSVVYCAVVAFAMWYFLEHTASGRRLYATGFNTDAARLAGVRVNRLRFGSLITSGFVAGIAGILLASMTASGTPDAGNDYLLPGFAAVFLGATQLKGGRFNAWGTIIAVLLLGTGTIGLGLASAPAWASNMFVGVVLIAALAVTGLQRRAIGSRQRWRDRLPRRGAFPAAPESGASKTVHEKL